MRTTLDIDRPVLERLKALQKREKRSLSKIASSLLSEALNQRDQATKSAPGLKWKSKSMRARVDLSDKEAVHRVLDAS